MVNHSTSDVPLIDQSYLDDTLIERHPSQTTIARLRQLLEPTADIEAPVNALVIGTSFRAASEGVVELETGGEIPVRAGHRVSLPLGYHHLHTPTLSQQLIVAPTTCVVPHRRAWAVSIQLYAARSTRSWGVGDLSDLELLRSWAKRQGATHVLINPLHAASPTLPQEPCPYAPASRLFASPLYLRPDDVPGAHGVDLSDLAAAGRALARSARIDRDAAWRLKQAALRRVFDAGPAREFHDWLRDQPVELHRFAIWCVLAERFGADTRKWPARFRTAENSQVQDYAQAHRDEVLFHQWLQWLLSRRAPDIGAHLIRDLAVGVRVGGADPWIWPGAFVEGATIGAPPDALNTRGQDWGLAPLHPQHLRRNGFRPFLDYVRAAMADASGIRIDHVLGVSRLWFVPEHAGAERGAYVRYPVDELLSIVALESQRSGAFVVGEDLGTVEPGLRDKLDRAGVLSSRVLLLADVPPQDWPRRSIATVSTHDLPTVTGLCSGVDRDDLHSAGVPDADHADAALRARLRRHVRDIVDSGSATIGAHEALVDSPSILLGASLEDVLGVAHRPNIPATNSQWNWTRPLPVPVDELPDATSGVCTVLSAASSRPA